MLRINAPSGRQAAPCDEVVRADRDFVVRDDALTDLTLGSDDREQIVNLGDGDTAAGRVDVSAGTVPSLHLLRGGSTGGGQAENSIAFKKE